MKISYNFDKNSLPWKMNYMLTDFDEITTKSLNDAMLKSAKLTKEKLKYYKCKDAAITLSGLDGELILHYLCNEGLDVVAYTLNLDNALTYEVECAEKICRKYNIDFKEIKVTAEELLDTGFVDKIFSITYSSAVTYTIVPYLYNHIPNSSYVIGGDGSIVRGYDRYLNMWLNHFERDIDIKNNFYIPCAFDNQTSADLSLKAFQKNGDMFWYSCCWDIWYHTLRHPLLETDKFSRYELRKIYNEEFKFISPVFTRKTLPSDTSRGFKASLKILSYIRQLAGRTPNYPYMLGDIITIPHRMLDLD